MTKIIDIKPSEAFRQASLTANDYMRTAFTFVKDEMEFDPVAYPEAFATLVAAHMHAASTDFLASIHASAADNVVEALSTLSVSASVHMENNDE